LHRNNLHGRDKKKLQRAACNKVIFILYVCCIEFKSFLREYLGKCGGVVVLFYGSSKVKVANEYMKDHTFELWRKT